MSLIQSQAGFSLADVYDIVGSIAGIEELHSREVTLTHDMASTIFSERMSSQILGTSSGNILQSTDIDTEMLGLPDTPFRIHQIHVQDADTNTVARLNNLCVVLVDEGGTRESIVWMWDGTVETQRVENAARAILMPEIGFASALPTIGMGGDQPRTVPQMFMRGRTAAFGAGNLNVALRVHFSFSQLEGVSSVGLPIPSW